VLNPAIDSKIFEQLSGFELNLAIPVEATGLRITDAMDSKWEGTLSEQANQLPPVPGHASISTTIPLYAQQVDSSMLAVQDSMMRALQPGSQTVQWLWGP